MKFKQSILWLVSIPCILYRLSLETRLTVSSSTMHNSNDRQVFFAAGDEEGDAVRRTQNSQGSVGICCMAKDARPYMDEFIDFHIYVDGFDAVYVYDNSDDHELWHQLKGSPYVKTIHFPGQAKQMLAYQDCSRRFGGHHNWLAFIDVDEFIVMEGNIVDYLNTFDKSVGEVSLNWLIFGSGNETVYRNKPVTSRFRYSEQKLNEHVKSLVRTAALNSSELPHVHFQRLKSGYHQVSSSGDIIEPKSPFHIPPIRETRLPVIHHYLFKSIEEYRAKGIRGRADKANSSLSNDTAMNRGVYHGDVYNAVAFELLQEFVPKYRTDSMDKLPDANTTAD